MNGCVREWVNENCWKAPLIKVKVLDFNYHSLYLPSLQEYLIPSACPPNLVVFYSTSIFLSSHHKHALSYAIKDDGNVIAGAQATWSRVYS